MVQLVQLSLSPHGAFGDFVNLKIFWSNLNLFEGTHKGLDLTVHSTIDNPYNLYR
jgi:hypothetical protein